MRFSPIAIGLSLALATVSSAGLSQKPAYQADPRAVALIEEGMAAQQAGEYDRAADLYESSLALDPGNADGYIALARVARLQKLPGKAIRYYREALQIDPSNLRAISGQGQAMVERGAVEKARKNLALLESLCKTRCAEAEQLMTAIMSSDRDTVLSADAVSSHPSVTTTPANNN